jgi:hypothetical protein
MFLYKDSELRVLNLCVVLFLLFLNILYNCQGIINSVIMYVIRSTDVVYFVLEMFL